MKSGIDHFSCCDISSLQSYFLHIIFWLKNDSVPSREPMRAVTMPGPYLAVINCSDLLLLCVTDVD